MPSLLESFMIPSAMLADIEAKGFIDLHSHVLCGLDDGPSTMEESLEIVAGMSDMGYSTIYATPHQRRDLYAPLPERIIESTAGLRERLRLDGATMKIFSGAENCWDDLLFEKSKKNEIITYEGTKTFLLEMPGFLLAGELSRQLFEWRKEGYLPVIAHLERYIDTPNLLERAGEMAETAVFTCNLEALGGAGGRRAVRVAREAVSQGIARVLCSDIHGKAWLKHTAKGLKWVRRNLPKGSDELLLRSNPLLVLSGEVPV